LYRRAIQAKDDLEDWLFPSYHYNSERRAQFNEGQVECMEKFLGPGGIDEMWYLKILAIHPDYQRRGVGAKLLNWGLERARARGEKVYLEASRRGKGLYTKLGFEHVGDLTLRDGETETIMPCMLWDPATAPGPERVEQVPVPQKIA